MTSIGTLRELDAEVKDSLRDEVPCEYGQHPQFGSGMAIMYGIQIPVKPCGCPGITVAYCAGCIAALQRAAAEGRPGWCHRCKARYEDPSLSNIARWEPVR